MEGKDLRGNVVCHGTGVRDLFYSSHIFDGAQFVGCFTEDDGYNKKVQLKFKVADDKEYDILLMPNSN